MDGSVVRFIFLAVVKLHSYIVDEIIASTNGKINYKQNSSGIDSMLELKQALERNQEKEFRKRRE